MALADDLAATKQALTDIDADSDKLAADTTAIQKRLDTLLGQIASATDLQAAQDLAVQAKAEAAKLGVITTALDAMGSTTP